MTVIVTFVVEREDTWRWTVQCICVPSSLNTDQNLQNRVCVGPPRWMPVDMSSLYSCTHTGRVRTFYNALLNSDMLVKTHSTFSENSSYVMIKASSFMLTVIYTEI